MRLTFFPKFLFQFLLICVFIFSTEVYSQEQDKDSLDRYSFKELSLKFKTNLHKDDKLARIYGNKLLSISNTKNDTLGMISTYNKLSILEIQLGNTEKALEFVDRAIFLAKTNPKYIVSEKNSSFKKGNILFYLGRNKKAFEYYTSIYDFYKKGKNTYVMNSISLNIALIKNILGDHETAIELFLKCFYDYENTHEDNRKTRFSKNYRKSVLLGLSSSYTKNAIKNSKKKDSLLHLADLYNTLGLKDALADKNIVYELRFISSAGIIQEELGNYNKALQLLDKALSKINNYKESSTLTAIYYYKGRSYKKLNQFDDAIKYFKKADSIATKNSANYSMLQGAYYSLIEIYKDRKDFENVSKYQDLYIENDHINEQISETLRKDIHEKYDIDRLTIKIDNLNKSNSKSIIIIGLLVLILVAFYIFYWRQRQKNKLAFNKLLKQLEANKKDKEVDSIPSKVLAIDDEKVVQVLKSLDKFEEKEWFRNKSCDLTFVAKKAKTNKTYLSKIIHEHKELKFIDYIRNLRINYALERLKDDSVFRSYDIKSIAEESGFKSSDMFSRAFVKNTGIYPSYYIKSINKINT